MDGVMPTAWHYVGIRKAERCFCLRCFAPKGKNREPGLEEKSVRIFTGMANPSLSEILYPILANFFTSARSDTSVSGLSQYTLSRIQLQTLLKIVTKKICSISLNLAA